MNILEKIKLVFATLDEIDDYVNELNDKLSKLDLMQQDILHLIETENLDAKRCCRVIKELKKIRINRRNIKNNIEISNKYNEQRERISRKDNRKFLLVELFKREKIINKKYNYRVYTQEEINNILK